MPHALNGVIVLHETGVEIQVPSLGALLWEVRSVFFESFCLHYGVVRDGLGFRFALERKACSSLGRAAKAHRR